MDVKQLKTLVREILEEKSKAKNLLDILPLLKGDEVERCPKLKVVHALQKALAHIIKRGDFEDGNAKYRAWLSGVYDEAWQCLLNCVDSPDKKLSTQSVATLVTLWTTKIVSFKGGPEAGSDEDSEWTPEMHKGFRGILSKLSSSKRDATVAIERFSEYLAYADVCTAAIQHLAKTVHTVKNISDESERKSRNSLNFRRNVIRILELITYPDQEGRPNMLSKKLSTEDLQQNFSNLWIDFFWLLGRESNVEIYKRVLIILHERVMPHLTKPLLLTDFLMESYDVGGSISLLALNGVFHLIHKYNLEYPDFYKKLYALFTPDVLHVKYRARFFHLSDLFLRSPLLPEYLVAAFVKRLSRLALTAPANTLPMVLQFLGNLLIRHPGLQKMAGVGSATACEMEEDPYVMEEPDPAKCGASGSFLWEIVSLQSHALPQIGHAAKILQKFDTSSGGQPVVMPEWNVNDLLENTYEDMFETETKKKVFVNVPLTFERPEGFKNPKNEIVSELFV